MTLQRICALALAALIVFGSSAESRAANSAKTADFLEIIDDPNAGVEARTMLESLIGLGIITASFGYYGGMDIAWHLQTHGEEPSPLQEKWANACMLEGFGSQQDKYFAFRAWLAEDSARKEEDLVLAIGLFARSQCIEAMGGVDPGSTDDALNP